MSRVYRNCQSCGQRPQEIDHTSFPSGSLALDPWVLWPERRTRHDIPTGHRRLSQTRLRGSWCRTPDRGPCKSECQAQTAAFRICGGVPGVKTSVFRHTSRASAHFFFCKERSSGLEARAGTYPPAFFLHQQRAPP
jgi:hypothetical protein